MLSAYSNRKTMSFLLSTVHATYMDLYTIGCTIEPPHRLVYSKGLVDMENLLLFEFCLRDLFVKNKDALSYARPIHRKGALAQKAVERV